MPRSSLAAVLALAMSACQADLPYDPPTTVNQAVFDPTTSQIPLPNDLAFFNDSNSVCPEGSVAPAGTDAACAQSELLKSFKGTFPSDQAVAITIDFQATTGAMKAPVDLDFATFTSTTFAVLRKAPGENTAKPVELEPITEADYARGETSGTLSIHSKGNEPWPQGDYSVFVRGGDNGVKTKSGAAIAPSQVFALIAQGKDMTDPKNIGLLKAQTGSTEKAIEQGAQLNQLIALYKAKAYPYIEPTFPSQELAVAVTFSIGAPYTNVTIDSARGKVPLPIDLLRDPTSGHLTPTAACAFAQEELAADGTCKAAAAAGFLALDGFSTTGAILASTSDLIQASTVTPSSVKLYDLTDPKQPMLVDPASLIYEPCEFTSSCSTAAYAPVIALQPSGATSAPPTAAAASLFKSKPLKDNTDYAVVITTDVKDKAGNAIAPGTVARILRFKNPINVGGKSMLSGISDETTAQLEKMRLQLQPVFATLAGASIPEDKVAMAYTFHTQTILSTAVELAALPYTMPATTGLPADVKTYADVDTAYTTYGAATIPHTNVGEVFETKITTFNLLDPATGAFNPDPSKIVEEQIPVLIITPKTATVTTACPGALSALKCSPLMVFRHGLSRGRADALAIANTFAAAGITTVAIDAAKHGDRTFCTSGGTGPTAGCNPGVACETQLPAGAQADEHPPGQCADGKLLKKGVTGTVGTTEGIAVASGNYLVTANFFRTRDTLRQDFIDESQLVRAIAYAPAGAPPTGHKVFDHMFATSGFVIDPTKIYYTGQSMGAIQGTGNVAINPRITKAALNVGGGTLVDVFTNSPAFAPTVNALLASLGIDKVNNPAGYLQFLTVAKTVLDPADAINFAGHLTKDTLPNLLADKTGKTAQAPKKVLTQMANCDTTVPNPFNLIHASNIGVGPTPGTVADFFTATHTGTFQLFVNSGFNAAGFLNCTVSGGVVPHGFLLDFSTPALTLAAQQSIADFVLTDSAQPSIEAP